MSLGKCEPELYLNITTGNTMRGVSVETKAPSEAININTYRFIKVIIITQK